MKNDIEITQLISLEELQKMQDLFSDATGVASIITTPEGIPVTQPSNFCRLCKEIIRKTEKGLSNCFRSDKTLGRYNPSGPVIQNCLSGGLWDAGASIQVGGKHIASWLIGQIRNQHLDEDRIFSYAEEIGADMEEFKTAFEEVPVMNMEQFEKVADLLFHTANVVSQIAFSNYQLKQSIEVKNLTEKELRRNEDRYLLLFDLNQAGIYRSTINGVLTECNERFAKILGYDSVDEIMQIPTTELYFTEGNREEFIKNLRKKGVLSNSELLMKSKQGTPVWILENVMLIEDDNPEHSIIQGTCTDITHRKEIEKALKESEARYRMLVENALDGIYLMRGRKYDYVNSRFTQITGYTFEEVTSPNFDFSILLTESSHKIVEERYAARQRGDEIPNQYDIEIKTKSGEIKYVNVSTVSMATQGEVVVTGMMHDITHRNIAQQALWESEERLNLAVSSTNIGLWDYDLEQNKIIRNTNWSQLLGFDPEEIPNTLEGFLELVHPEDLPQVRSVSKWLNEGTTDLLKITHRMRTKDGNWKWILNSGKIVKRDKTGRPLRSIGVHFDVDVPKRAEDALRISDATYRGIINSVTDAIFIQDENGTFLDFNNAAELMFGGSREELLGRNPQFLAASSKNDFDEISQHVKLAFEGTPNNLEFWGRRKDGQLFVRDVNLTPGEYFGRKVVIAIARDITERKRSEEALKESEERYSTFINSTDDMVYIKDEKLRYVVVNQKNIDFFGKTKSEIIGKLDVELMPHEIAHNCRKTDLQAIHENRIVISTEIVGDRIYESRKFPMTLSEGKTGVGGFIRDITEKVAADERVKVNEHFQTQLNEITTRVLDTSNSEELFKVLSDQISRLFNADECYITLWNEDSKIAVPYTASVMPTDQFRDLKFNSDEITMTESVLTAEHPLIAEDVLNTPYQSRSISILFPARSIMGLPMMVAENKLGAIIIAFNTFHKFTVDEVKRGEIAARQISLIVDKMRIVENLRRNEDRLKQINIEKDKFFSIIAHDIKSPFSAFLGLTEIMADDFDHFTLKEIQSFILTMRNSASNLYRLLENLLEWSRIQRGITEFNPKSVALSGVVNESFELLQQAAAKKDIEIVHHIPENFKVYADIHMLETILRNLTSNALKFTPKGGKITISAISENKASIIIVKDTGIGMSPQMIADLFRIDANTSRPGTDNEPSTGLGLILCKEFVEKHGGKIWAVSEETKGSQFFINLPFEK